MGTGLYKSPGALSKHYLPSRRWILRAVWVASEERGVQRWAFFFAMFAMKSGFFLFCAVLFASIRPGVAAAADWEVPVAGNAYVAERPAEGGDGISREGGLRWQDAGTVFALFFHVDRPAVLDLAVRVGDAASESTIRTKAAGKSFETTVAAGMSRVVPIGQIEVKQAGYVRVDLQGVKKAGAAFADVRALVVSSETKDLGTAFVKTNEGNMFYWGRRGPSVHLGYKMPAGKTIEYAYSEITVPVGQDPIGSYFMANGFGEGYFGIQVKSPTERWVLFSVWSPFHTDNPKDIPADQRVELLAKGENVRAGEFGNEGSGGQSFMVYPWKAGTTYRFLNTAKPDGKGNTIYAAWFGEAGKEGWQLIARFKRPKTEKHLTGFHSFLENFHPETGHIGRRALHGNQWVRDTDGNWHELLEAGFTGDGTASGRHRLDYAGGVAGNGFFMRNCGFFSERVEINQTFRRPPNPAGAPKVDFGALK